MTQAQEAAQDATRVADLVDMYRIAVRIKETASRIRLAFAANCPDAELFRGLIRSLTPRPT